MNSLHVAPAASNAVAAPGVRTARPAAVRRFTPITFPAVLTDELFEEWLDAYPQRRRGHERQTAKQRAEERERVARMYALRCCDASLAFSKALGLAQQLHDQLEEILRLFGPNEAERVLKAAGLRIPTEYDIDQAYAADTFEQAHRASVKLKRRVEKFIDRVHESLWYVMPDCFKQEEQERQRVIEGKSS